MHVLIFYPGGNGEGYVGLLSGNDRWVVQPVAEVVAGASCNPVLEAVEAVLAAREIPLSHVTHIGVMHGPASYTQLRVFIATANTLAWVRHVPLFSFGPDARLPDDIPPLLSHARVNVPVKPVYPTELGA